MKALPGDQSALFLWELLKNVTENALSPLLGTQGSILPPSTGLIFGCGKDGAVGQLETPLQNCSAELPMP